MSDVEKLYGVKPEQDAKKRNKNRMKPKFTHTVTSLELGRAFRVWYEIMNHKHSERGYANPHVFFKNQIDFSGIPETVRVTELGYRKIRMLNSPHARVLLKAFKAKTGYHKDIP